MKKRNYILIIGMVLVVAWVATGSWRCSRSDDAQQVDTIPMLVMQIQKCSRLYTTEYRIRKIVTHSDVVSMRGQLFSQNYNVQLPLGDRKVAIPMEATLKGYVDFSNFKAEQVHISGRQVQVTLPDPRVVLTSSKIDQKGIREYVALTRSHFSDAELSEYERQGREAIVRAIPQMGIVESARQSAARLLIPLFVQMGYREQDITISFSSDFNQGDLRRLLDQTNMEP